MSPPALGPIVRDALAALNKRGHSIPEAAEHVPSAPGLYTVHGVPAAWHDLGLGDPPDERPLYVGKAEASLVARDLKTHFGTGRTGSSTLRRSFAALLRKTLDLHAQPRNPAKPERPANFGLEGDGDVRLTAWMTSRLTLSVWPTPDELPLIDVEPAVLDVLRPPLNLTDVVTPWTPALKAARRAMADEARAWARARGFEI